MAETKQAKPKKSRSKKSSTGSSSKSKASANGAKAKAGKAASSASSNGAGHGVASGVGPIVQKAKLPLLAGGAAVAGVAGAVLVSRNGGRRKVLGVSVPKRSKLSLPDLPKTKGLKSDARKVTGAVTAAAKRADDFGQNVSRIASSVQKVGESADEAVKKN